jgi:hypothetical protein
MNDDGIYDMVQEESEPRGLPGRVVSCGDVYEVVDRCAADLYLMALAAVEERGECSFVVSDTETVERVLRAMMVDPRTRGFPWRESKVWVMPHDERGDAQAMVEMLVQHGGVAVDRCTVLDLREERWGSEVEAHAMLMSASERESPPSGRIPVRARHVSVLAASGWSEGELQRMAEEMHGTVAVRFSWYLDSSTERS